MPVTRVHSTPESVSILTLRLLSTNGLTLLSAGHLLRPEHGQPTLAKVRRRNSHDHRRREETASLYTGCQYRTIVSQKSQNTFSFLTCIMTVVESKPPAPGLRRPSLNTSSKRTHESSTHQDIAHGCRHMNHRPRTRHDADEALPPHPTTEPMVLLVCMPIDLPPTPHYRLLIL